MEELIMNRFGFNLTSQNKKMVFHEMVAAKNASYPVILQMSATLMLIST